MMFGERKFLLFVFVGFVLLVTFWARPPPSIRAYAPKWPLSKTTPPTTTTPTTDKDAIEHLAPEFAGQHIASIVHTDPASSTADASSSTSHHEAPVAASTSHQEHASTVVAATESADHTFSLPPAPTHSATAITHSPAPVDPFTAGVSIDQYAYLHESKSEATHAHTHGTGSVIAAAKETEAVNEFAYLSASTSEAQPSAHLNPASSETRPATAVLSGFITSTVAAQHSVDVPHYHTGGGHGESPHQRSAAHATPASSNIQQHASTTSIEIGVTTAPDPSKTEFGGETQFFQARLTDYALPDLDLDKLKRYAPHNYKGPGHETYATFLSTRNASLQDPYFLATLQMTHRLLWDPKIKSKDHPFTVFVAPHIPQPQRDYLAASGALVKELELIEYHPQYPTEAAPRWRDMFSKLNLWAQTDFSKILYLDTDAFPINPLDELWEITKPQQCDPNLLSAEDKLVISDICDYTFTAVGEEGDINAGMLIFNPNMAMHSRLIRESQDGSKFDQMYMEQAFLNYAYSHKGPFPAQPVPRKWNAIFTNNDDDGKLNVVHEKLWAMWWMPEHFASQYFRTNWDEMLERYKTPDWLKARAADGPVKT